jgi:hypothetical protein
MRESFDWFLGRNRLRLPMYDFATAGCYDALGRHDVNQNQGAESGLSFLLSLLAMLDVIVPEAIVELQTPGRSRPESPPDAFRPTPSALGVGAAPVGDAPVGAASVEAPHVGAEPVGALP